MVQGWEPGTAYGYGDIVEFDGARYKIIQPHTSQGDWTPSVTPALWGRIPDDEWQHHDAYEPPHDKGDYHPETVQQPSDYTQHPDQTVEVPHEEQKKKWWDLDDDRKKQVEIGGGLLAGAAALGAGYFAWHKHEEHKKSEGDKQALTWGLQSWLRDAQARTEEFRRHGPRAPATWLLVEGRDKLPRGAFEVGRDRDGNPIYAARAFFEDGLQVGKASAVFKEGAVIGFGGSTVELNKFEVLAADSKAVRWVPFRGQLNLQALGARPVEGGREADGTQLYVAQVDYHDGRHAAKIGEHLGAALVPFNGTEVSIEEYSVLCYN
ncbi:carbohydrate-binding module family 12 protein [Gloeopeniophorella convolvens]|nr:carbohydrate-binding module family 12 protein [Gloeopeniophorella convolvens]